MTFKCGRLAAAGGRGCKHVSSLKTLPYASVKRLLLRVMKVMNGGWKFADGANTPSRSVARSEGSKADAQCWLAISAFPVNDGRNPG
jgi:hypothetical protein